MGDPACWLSKVCESCGQMLDHGDVDSCANCESPTEGAHPAPSPVATLAQQANLPVDNTKDGVR